MMEDGFVPNVDAPIMHKIVGLEELTAHVGRLADALGLEAQNRAFLVGQKAGLAHATKFSAILTRQPVMRPDWTLLQDLRPGAIFETRAGVQAVKTDSGIGGGDQWRTRCVLLASGGFTTDLFQESTEVREIVMPTSPEGKL